MQRSMDTHLHLLSRYHRHGDADAFGVLVRDHAGMVFATARRITGDAALAEDVALSVVAAAAKRGDTTLTVADTSKLQAGTRIVLELTDDSARTLVAHVYRGDSGELSKLRETYALTQVLTVVKIEGQTLTVDRPLRADVSTEWTPVLKRYAPTLENCGVEHLTIEFPPTPYRGHWTEEGFNPVEIKGAADCWLSGLKIVNPDSGPFIIGSVFCTLDGIEFVSTRKPAGEDIQGHHGISLMGVDCLCRNFTIGMKFFHDLTVSQGSTGNVFSNGRAADLAIDNHRHGPYENLFTQIDAGLGTRLWTSGGSSGQGKHAAAGAVFWNIKTKKDLAMPSADFAPDDGLVLAGLKLRARKSEAANIMWKTSVPAAWSRPICMQPSVPNAWGQPRRPLTPLTKHTHGPTPPGAASRPGFCAWKAPTCCCAWMARKSPFRSAPSRPPAFSRRSPWSRSARVNENQDSREGRRMPGKQFGWAMPSNGNHDAHRRGISKVHSSC